MPHPVPFLDSSHDQIGRIPDILRLLPGAGDDGSGVGGIWSEIEDDDIRVHGPRIDDDPRAVRQTHDDPPGIRVIVGETFQIVV